MLWPILLPPGILKQVCVGFGGFFFVLLFEHQCGFVGQKTVLGVSNHIFP